MDPSLLPWSAVLGEVLMIVVMTCSVTYVGTEIVFRLHWLPRPQQEV